MGESSQSCASHLGFLTVVDNEQLGLVGGYLLLNAVGRPIEFHCTAPVKPSRAQQILFGPTLKPYLYGEQITQALIKKSDLQPAVVWTDEPAVIAAREFISVPLALLLDSGSTTAEASSFFDRMEEFAIGNHRAAVTSSQPSDMERILSNSAILASFDLSEPFGRIREAIEEAHRAMGNRQAA